MAILVPADQATYFPEVMLTGAALLGAIAYAQSLCESVYGANTRLEQTDYRRICPIADNAFYLPVLASAITLVEIRSYRDGFGRVNTLEWFTLTAADWVFDDDLSRVLLQSAYATNEGRITFTSGYDFTALSPGADVVTIKSTAGRVLTHIANNHPGLERYSLDAGLQSSVENASYAPLDETLTQLLMPLKRYMPRYAS